MMYNRYVPDAAGVYRPTRVEDVPPPPPVQPPAPPPVPEAPPEPPAPCPPLPVRQDAGGGLLSRLPRPVRRSMADFCRGCCRAASTRAIC